MKLIKTKYIQVTYMQTMLQTIANRFHREREFDSCTSWIRVLIDNQYLIALCIDKIILTDWQFSIWFEDNNNRISMAKCSWQLRILERFW